VQELDDVVTQCLANRPPVVARARNTVLARVMRPLALRLLSLQRQSLRVRSGLFPGKVCCYLFYLGLQACVFISSSSQTVFKTLYLDCFLLFKSVISCLLVVRMLSQLSNFVLKTIDNLIRLRATTLDRLLDLLSQLLDRNEAFLSQLLEQLELSFVLDSLGVDLGKAQLKLVDEFRHLSLARVFTCLE